MIKTLKDNGATLSSGDVGSFACFAVEQNNLDLLKKIVQYGGDVTLPKSTGSSALHTAVTEENTEIVKFLIEQGADIDKPDQHGWTPRDLAEHQAHEEIKVLLHSKKDVKATRFAPFSGSQGVPNIKKHMSEPTLPPHMVTDDSSSMAQQERASVSTERWRRRANNFEDSIFGIITAARRSSDG